MPCRTYQPLEQSLRPLPMLSDIGRAVPVRHIARHIQSLQRTNGVTIDKFSELQLYSSATQYRLPTPVQANFAGPSSNHPPRSTATPYQHHNLQQLALIPRRTTSIPPCQQPALPPTAASVNPMWRPLGHRAPAISPPTSSPIPMPQTSRPTPTFTSPSTSSPQLTSPHGLFHSPSSHHHGHTSALHPHAPTCTSQRHVCTRSMPPGCFQSAINARRGVVVRSLSDVEDWHPAAPPPPLLRPIRAPPPRPVPSSSLGFAAGSTKAAVGPTLGGGVCEGGVRSWSSASSSSLVGGQVGDVQGNGRSEEGTGKASGGAGRQQQQQQQQQERQREQAACAERVDPGDEAGRVVCEHVSRQRAVAPERLDPAGSHDADQVQPGVAGEAASAAAGAGAGAAAPGKAGAAGAAAGVAETGLGSGLSPSASDIQGWHARAGSPVADLPLLDGLRASPRAVYDSSTSSSSSHGDGKGAGDGVGSGVGAGGGGRGGGGGPAVARDAEWAGLGVAVPSLPCGTIGYGTRADVVARLPASIMLLRHAECLTLDEHQAHERVPNHDIPLNPHGRDQARLLGARLRPLLRAEGMSLFLCTSPFLRCSETTRLLVEELGPGSVAGLREAVQLREQDWGNFQDPKVQAECKEERLRYGRFYYRFPSGESVSDVYDRITLFQDHLVRDMCSGRFNSNITVAIVTHGLTLRVFAMRWLHWTVQQFLQVYNVPNAEPIMLHKDVDPAYLAGDNGSLPFMPHHVKCLYRLSPRALELLRGADPSMAASSGCWSGQLMAHSARGSGTHVGVAAGAGEGKEWEGQGQGQVLKEGYGGNSEDELERQWSDVYGLIDQ